MKRDPTRAERQRWARWRRRYGKRALTVYVDEEIVEEAILSGVLLPEEAGDKHETARILGQMLENSIE